MNDVRLISLVILAALIVVGLAIDIRSVERGRVWSHLLEILKYTVFLVLGTAALLAVALLITSLITGRWAGVN